MQQRILTIDVVRGAAVMGILLMNILSFALPERAALSPRAWLPEGFANTEIWATSFILIDNKFRGLFSLLFGASLLLMLKRTEEKGENPLKRHFRRALWLLVFGLLHLIFIWEGDILTLYALIGCVAVLFHAVPFKRKIAVATLCFIAHFAIWAAVVGDSIALDHAARQPGASAEVLASAQKNRLDWGDTGSIEASEQVALHQSGYSAIFKARLAQDGDMPIRLAVLFGAETLGLMLLGMALLESGLLSGHWPQARTLRLAGWAYAVSLPGMAGLTVWCALRDWNPVITSTASLLWSIPFREIMVVGHVALLVWLAVAYAHTPIIRRIAAVGQTALSNYIGTSVLMTSIFYGYGLGLFGIVTRAQAYLFCLPAFALMLFWSPLWLRYFRQGPLEWVWRCLTDWMVVPIWRAKGQA